MAPQNTILVLNGPNLNLLGTREPHIYGSTTLPMLTTHLTRYAASLTPPLTLTHYQSNHEGALIDAIHAARETAGFIIMNAGALTHTSVGLRDALAGVAIPFVEVHVSNVYKREEFRHRSYLSEKAEAVVAGLGVFGYEAAVGFAGRFLEGREKAVL